MQPFPINIVDLVDNKVLVGSDVVVKDEVKNNIIGDPRTPRQLRGVVTWKAPNKRMTNKTEGPGEQT